MPNPTTVTTPKSFIPYGRQAIDDNDIQAVVEVLKSDWLTQGPKVKEFESAICNYTGAKHAVAVANGTAALHMAALAAGFKQGDEVITSPNTFLASANCILYCNATPVFCDIDINTYNLDTRLLKDLTTPHTKGIIPVHFAGLPCDMEEIYDWARKNHLTIIEDACHALGATYKGSRIGDCTYSDMTVFSFHPVKHITTGEGGVVTTNSAELYEKLLLLRNHGMTKEPDKMTKNEGPWYYEMQVLGFNYRITDMQCTLGILQLKKADVFLRKRQSIAQVYDSGFKGIEWLRSEAVPKDRTHAYHLYPVLIDFKKINKTRAQVMGFLKEKNIGTQVHYIPVYKQPYYQNRLPRSKELSVTELYYSQALSLPMFPSLTSDEQTYVIDTILKLQA